MTAYLAEAKRLNVDVRDIVTENIRDFAGRPDRDNEGLHIFGCKLCRVLRNRVRAALRDEQTAIAEEARVLAAIANREERRFTLEDMDRAFDEGKQAGLMKARELVRACAYQLGEDILDA